ncbi:hypothetical protein [Streptomyces kanasensis]|uniref:hypothetical protein n=1 Tax=Streptomyces kanasensis TaxID=936756 RepID=UPI0037FA7081
MNQPPPGQQPNPPQNPAGGTPPPPQKKSSTGKIVGLGCLGVVVLFVVIGAIGSALTGTSDTGDTSNKPAPATSSPASDPAEKRPAEEPPAEKPKAQSQTEQFKSFVEKNGTAAEKKAVKHVTRVQGADKQNNILDTAEIHTDYTGGLLGPHGGNGKLLASAFAEWKSSENGLVTVYDSAGEILANGNF